MIRAVLLAATALSLAAPALAQSPTSTPLIERARLFGNPAKANGKISPDGRWLSWTAPRDGVLNIWVAPAADPAKARPLTTEKLRPIRQYYWAPDSASILYVNDKGGDENFLLYGVDVASGQERALTPFAKTRAEIVAVSSHVKDRILVGVNNRDARWHDVHSLDLKTGKLSLVQRNDGYTSFLADEQLNLRLASRTRADGGEDYFRIRDGRIEAKPYAAHGLADALTTRPLGYSADGGTLYWLDSTKGDTSVLTAEDAATGKRTVLGEDRRADVTEVLADPATGRIQAWKAEYLREEWHPLDRAVGADLAFLQAKLPGENSILARTDAGDKWVVLNDPVTAPAATWLYDSRAKRLTQLFVGRAELEGAPLVAMHPQEIRARDGKTLVSYLSLPKEADPDGDGKANRPVPMVLFVHGGPWARDSYGYYGTHQWLANRGYAVLSVNYRGSTGFGKKFISAGDLQWGRAMHDDLIDAVDWAVKAGVTAQDKVAIMGGSYGGYATLAGVTMTPDRFRCGVDIVGPSNLFTLLETIPPYWEAGKQQFYQRMGDPTTAAGRALLKERSPLFLADRIKVPLLIGQGANDPRVNVRESDQIVAEMQSKKIPVTYVLFPDEGHGFARPVNNIAFNAVAENFLAQCLGGRAEPIGGAVKASTAQVKAGAAYVPGLEAATATR